MQIERLAISSFGVPVITLMVVGAFVLLVLSLKLSSRRNRLLAALGTYFTLVLFAILSARAVDWYIEARIKSYNPRELWWMNSTVPPGYEYLLKYWIQDTGRSMVFVTAPLMTPILMAFVYVAIWICRLPFRRSL